MTKLRRAFSEYANASGSPYHEIDADIALVKITKLSSQSSGDTLRKVDVLSDVMKTGGSSWFDNRDIKLVHRIRTDLSAHVIQIRGAMFSVSALIFLAWLTPSPIDTASSEARPVVEVLVSFASALAPVKIMMVNGILCRSHRGFHRIHEASRLPHCDSLAPRSKLKNPDEGA